MSDINHSNFPPQIPNAHWLLGHLPLMQNEDFRAVLYKFSVEHADEYGRCSFYMGRTVPGVSVTEPADVQQVLKASATRQVFPLMAKHFAQFLGNRNVGILNGKEWKTQRQAITKALHEALQLQTVDEAVTDTTKKLVKSIQIALTKQQNMTLDLLELMKRLTMNIFGRVALHVDDMGGDVSSLDCSTTSQEVEAFEFLTAEVMRRLTTGLLDPSSYIYSLPTSHNRQHKHHKSVLRNHVTNIVRERQEQIDQPDCPQDLLTKLIEVQRASPDLPLSQETLSDTLLGLLFAGYETTAVTLTYALYLISIHPTVERKCLDEIQSGQKLVYLQAVIWETLRLYPPAISTTRGLDRPLVLGGQDNQVEVPAGTYMYIPIWIIQRDAKTFAEPEQFWPERWVRPGPGGWQRRTRGDNDNDALPPMGNLDAFIPFSAGARSCPGRDLALKEMTIVLSILLPELHFSALPDYVLVPFRTGFVQQPKDGMPMSVSLRVGS